MPILGKSFRERNPMRVAVVGIIVILALLAGAFKFSAIMAHFTQRSYSADFAEAGGLKGGEEVRISGYNVGKVSGVRLVPGAVKVSFTVGKNRHLGSDTRASISTATVLGTKYVQLDPSGPGSLAHHHIAMNHTTSPYDITQVLAQLTTTTSAVNTTQLAASLTTLSDAFSKSPPEVQSALTGVARLSNTVASRDAALRQLLSNTNGVTAILAARRAQFTTLFADGNSLLNALYAQRDAYHDILVNVTAVIGQLNGLVADNTATLKPALMQLQGVLSTLNSHQSDIVAAINGLKRYGTGLGESVGGGPFFYALVQNIGATNFLNVDQKTLVNGLLGGAK